MSENPKCPYCGGEMRYAFNGDIVGAHFLICETCLSRSPVVSFDDDPYAAAMKRERPKAKNIGADYAEQDQFICSECGIHLQDWVRIDEDDYEDGIVHEYVFRFCPNCGRRIDDE